MCWQDLYQKVMKVNSENIPVLMSTHNKRYRSEEISPLDWRLTAKLFERVFQHQKTAQSPMVLIWVTPRELGIYVNLGTQGVE